MYEYDWLWVERTIINIYYDARGHIFYILLALICATHSAPEPSGFTGCLYVSPLTPQQDTTYRVVSALTPQSLHALSVLS